MAITDTIQTAAAAIGQPLNSSQLDMLRSVLLANSPTGGDLGDPLTDAELAQLGEAYPPDSLIGRLVHQARLMLGEQELEIEREREAETAVRAALAQRDALLAELAILRHAIGHPVVFEAVTASYHMIQEQHAGEPQIVEVYADAWRNLQSALLGDRLGEAAARMWRADQALITRIRTTLDPLWLALLDLPREGDESAPWPVALNLALWRQIAATLGDAFGSRAVEPAAHDWPAFLLPGVTPLRERGVLASLLIGDHQLTLTLGGAVVTLTDVTAVLPGQDALADMAGRTVEITQVGHASYLVRSSDDADRAVRIMTAAASRAPRPIAQGVLREIALGPQGLTLDVGADRVTFAALGAFSPAGLSQLHGAVVSVTEVAAGHYAIAGPTGEETILADTVEVVSTTDSHTGAHVRPWTDAVQ